MFHNLGRAALLLAPSLLFSVNAAAAPTIWPSVSLAMDTGDYAKAEKFLRDSSLTASQASHQAALGLILTKRRQYPTAETAFLLAIELEPFNSNHQWNLGEFYYLTGEFSKAASAYANVNEASPQYHLAIYKQILSLLQSKQLEACRQLIGTLRFSEQTPLFLHAHAALHFQMGNIAEGRWFAESARALYEADGVRIYRQPLIDLGWINTD